MNTVLSFWFAELESSDWYKKSDDLDARIKQQFEPVYHKVVAGETAHWRDSAAGRLAEIIVLDQFARNMYRASPQAFAADPLALALSQEAIRAGDDHRLGDEQKRAFMYMPFMHSESATIHEQALKLFTELPNLEYEIKHKNIIDRFGRYPHRNEVLGRASTLEELEFLKTNPGF